MADDYDVHGGLESLVLSKEQFRVPYNASYPLCKNLIV